MKQADQIGAGRMMEHNINLGNGRGGFVYKQAGYGFFPRFHGARVVIFGLAAMENGEVAAMGVYCDDDSGLSWTGENQNTVITFSADSGTTWSEYLVIEGLHSRPMMLTYLGKGALTFVMSWEKEPHAFFSRDHGRTWDERVAQQKVSNGGYLNVEGNRLVDRDESGSAVRIAEVGSNHADGSVFPEASCEFIRWSSDGGRTWDTDAMPMGWRFQETYQGRTYTRSVSEGALVRAANGWLVAALRTNMPQQYVELHHDNYEGISVSLSKDEGESWSSLLKLYDAGRHHMNLICLPNGDIVMPYIVRQDFRGGKMVSYRRGCEALISHDNGLSWDLHGRYILDEFNYYDGVNSTLTGHLASTLLDDGSILTTYGNYLTGSPLIRWTP